MFLQSPSGTRAGRAACALKPGATALEQGLNGRDVGAAGKVQHRLVREENPEWHARVAGKQGHGAGQLKLAALRTFEGRSPAPQLDLLGQLLAAAARDRLQSVGGVVTGETKRAITHKVEPA